MEPFMIFSAVLAAVIIIFLVWFFLFADCDLFLTWNTIFGHQVSVFEGKVIWITGASTGLGEAIAYELASVGAKLILSARRTGLLERVKSKCLDISQGKLTSGDILVLPLDITDCDAHEDKFREALEHFHYVDVLIDNAGRMQVGSCGKTSIDVERDLFNINYFGPVNLTKLVLNHFQERRKGQILCISSFFTKLPTAGVAAYSATKHALHGFFDSVRMEYNNKNIKVTVVHPGFFDSEIEKHMMSERKGEILKDARSCEIQMPVSRCAHLTLVATANNSYEAWMAYQPFLFLMYMAHYLSDVRTFIFLPFNTKAFVSECVQGRYPKSFPAWRPLFCRN